MVESVPALQQDLRLSCVATWVVDCNCCSRAIDSAITRRTTWHRISEETNCRRTAWSTGFREIPKVRDNDSRVCIRIFRIGPDRVEKAKRGEYFRDRRSGSKARVSLGLSIIPLKLGKRGDFPLQSGGSYFPRFLLTMQSCKTVIKWPLSSFNCAVCDFYRYGCRYE